MAVLIEVSMCPCRDSKKCSYFRNDTYLICSTLSSSPSARSRSKFVFTRVTVDQEVMSMGLHAKF
jgi:hypothetical protein